MNDLKFSYPAHPKDRGQWAELLFMATAARLALKIAKPYGDNARFDLIVEAAGRLLRVQVKCTSVLRYGWYRCICCWSRRTAEAVRRPDAGPLGSPDQPILSGKRKPGGIAMRYTKRDVDFIAIYVIQDDSWFIIPVERIRHKVLDLPPRDAASPSRWEQYREAWHLLGARPGVTLHAAADASNDLSSAARLSTPSHLSS